MLSLYTALIDSEEGRSNFEQLYFNYQKQMFYIAREILHNDMLAEDAVQEAFIGIAKQIERIQIADEKKIKAYVFIAAKNAALYIQKKEQKKAYCSVEYDFVADMSSPDTLEMTVAASIQAENIRAAIASIPEKYREVLLLRLVYEMSHEEIAETLHRPQNTVRKQFERAKKILAEICMKEGIV